jgi:hypothetical protein
VFADLHDRDHDVDGVELLMIIATHTVTALAKASAISTWVAIDPRRACGRAIVVATGFGSCTSPNDGPPSLAVEIDRDRRLASRQGDVLSSTRAAIGSTFAIGQRVATPIPARGEEPGA